MSSKPCLHHQTPHCFLKMFTTAVCCSGDPQHGRFQQPVWLFLVLLGFQHKRHISNIYPASEVQAWPCLPSLSLLCIPEWCSPASLRPGPHPLLQSSQRRVLQRAGLSSTPPIPHGELQPAGQCWAWRKRDALKARGAKGGSRRVGQASPFSTLSLTLPAQHPSPAAATGGGGDSTPTQAPRSAVSACAPSLSEQ